mmetsp:Transcript_30928/g.82098  ORF Transcript_30928/g.82098 Transcript_30928/m.82098 type:complete len:263 (+) Transcript_30928:831-1619(+)
MKSESTRSIRSLSRSYWRNVMVVKETLQGSRTTWRPCGLSFRRRRVGCPGMCGSCTKSWKRWRPPCVGRCRLSALPWKMRSGKFHPRTHCSTVAWPTRLLLGIWRTARWLSWPRMSAGCRGRCPPFDRQTNICPMWLTNGLLRSRGLCKLTGRGMRNEVGSSTPFGHRWTRSGPPVSRRWVGFRLNVTSSLSKPHDSVLGCLRWRSPQRIWRMWARRSELRSWMRRDACTQYRLTTTASGPASWWIMSPQMYARNVRQRVAK